VSNKVNEFLAGFPPQEVAMNRVTRLAFILSLASTASVAQVSVMDFPFVPLETGCPIGVRATLEKTRILFAPQRLEVTLTNVHLPVSALRITVHGVAPVADIPTPSETGESLDLNRVMAPRPYPPTEQKQSPKGQGEMAALDDVLGTIGTPVILRSSSGPQRWYGWVTGFTAVNFIDLDSVSYGDGTSWHAANGKTCRLSLGSSPW
jgi:hypothetical protein